MQGPMLDGKKNVGDYALCLIAPSSFLCPLTVPHVSLGTSKALDEDDYYYFSLET